MAVWSIHALSSHSSGPSFVRFARSGWSSGTIGASSLHSWSRSYLALPASDQLCDTKAATSPSFAGIVIA